MRFPLRDVIPSRTRPLVTVACALCASATLLVMYPAPVTAAFVMLNVVPLVVFGETIEDQMGHGRYLALLGATAALALMFSGAAAVLPALVAAVSGAHLSLFPTSRILLTLWIQLIEIPSFFMMGCWLFVMVLLPGPLGAIALAAPLGAVAARLLRQPHHARWDHFDVVS